MVALPRVEQTSILAPRLQCLLPAEANAPRCIASPGPEFEARTCHQECFALIL